MYKKLVWLYSIIIFLTVSMCLEAFAQSDSEVLEEILVTGQRRSENLQDTAISASVLTGDALDNKGVTELYDLQYAAPSINISAMGSANIFNIRGIGRSQVDIDVPSGVVIYRDGAPTVAGYFQREPYFDIGSVEVFRGPQGTFVGKSAAGGAVFINTNDASLDGFSANVEVGAGNFSSRELTGVINAPLSDTFALRFGYKHNERDHFYESITGDYTGNPGEVDNNSYRLSALWEPSANFSATAKVDYHDLDFGGNVTTQFGEDLLGDVEQNLYGKEFTYTDESLRTVVNINYEFDSGLNFGSLTAYQDLDTVNNLDAGGGLGFLSKANVKIVSQEFNLVSQEDQAFRWITGLFFQNQQASVPDWRDDGFVFDLGGPYPFAGSFWEKDESDWAIFAHLSFDLSEQLELEIGTRYSEYEMDQETEWLAGDTTVPLVLGEPSVAPFQLASPGGDQQDMQEDSFDWQIALNYTQNDQQFFYGLISRGHITGGINLFPGVDPPPFYQYDEMEVINIEGGVKSSWLDDQFRTQFSVYYQMISDYQANFANAGAVVNNPLNRNADDDSKVYGFELSGQYYVENLALDFGIAYLDSELGSFSDVTNPITSQVVDLSGAKSPFSPEFTGNIGLTYDIMIGADFRLAPRVDIAHTSETQAALWFDENFTLEERTLVNGQLVFAPLSETWSLTLWATNLTDEEYVAGIQNNATLYYAGAPRQIGLRYKYNF